MGLKIAKERTFTRAITALAPVDGGFEEETFGVTFRALESTELATFDTGTQKGVTAFLARAIVKLDDVEGSDGKPVPYSDTVRDQVIQLTYARVALVREYFASVGKAKEGN